jgi:endonuclease-3
MATTTNKQRVLTQLFALHKKAHEAPPPEPRPVLEQFLYALCRQDATREQADRAFRRLRDSFFDWNEVRVSSVRELEEALAGLPNAEARAERLIAFLQEVFETTFSFDLEGLHKKGLKQAAKQLLRYRSADDYVGAWVLQQSLGGHAIPVDGPTLRVSRRLGLIDGDQDDPEAQRASLEHLVPKAKGAAFGELVSTVAAEYCWDDNPNCSSCPLAAECPTAQEAGAADLSAARVSRAKPR